MLDALIHREDGQVPGTAQAPVVIHLLQRPQHGDGAIAGSRDAVDEVRARLAQPRCRDGLAAMTEEALGVLPEDLLDARE